MVLLAGQVLEDTIDALIERKTHLKGKGNSSCCTLQRVLPLA